MQPERFSGAWCGSERSAVFACMACAALAELSALLCRPRHLRYWNVDDEAGYELAGIQAHELGAAVGYCEFCGADCFLSAGSICGRVGRTAQSPQASGVDTGCVGSASSCHGCVDALDRRRGYRDADGACCTLVAIWFMFRLPRTNASMQSIYRKTGQLSSDELELVVEEAAH